MEDIPIKILILYAHPNPKSFNHAILEKCLEVVKSFGHEADVRDLYQMGFNPVLNGKDFEALSAGQQPEDIKAEQEKIKAADTIISIYPIWWTGMPAILKGYIDRVFSFGFAYSYEEGMPKPLLFGRKSLIINTMGSDNERYDSTGMTDSMKQTTDEGIMAFCGIEPLGHILFGAVLSSDDATRKDYLSKLEHRLKSYFD